MLIRSDSDIVKYYSENETWITNLIKCVCDDYSLDKRISLDHVKVEVIERIKVELHQSCKWRSILDNVDPWSPPNEKEKFTECMIEYAVNNSPEIKPYFECEL